MRREGTELCGEDSWRMEDARLSLAGVWVSLGRVPVEGGLERVP